MDQINYGVVMNALWLEFIIKVKELIDILKTYNPESEVRIASDEYGDIELEIQNVSENSIDGGPLIL